MSAFNTSTRREDVSLRLRAQSNYLNMRTAKEQSKKLELENRKMEERLRELKVAMSREKEEREQNGGGFWRTGQSGSLSTYATDVLDKPVRSSKEHKKKGIRVLRDEPLDVPSRSSEPGTMKYIAKTSQNTRTGKENRPKGPKCGQCEDRIACLTCVQCSEHYCSGCFAAFHLRGALKKHRSVPLQASGPRQCMSPRPMPPPSHREMKPSPAVGAVSSTIRFQESERNGPEGASGSYELAGDLLTGQYNETESAASFQAALLAWRQGDDIPSPTVSPRMSVSPRKTKAAADVHTATTMTSKPDSPQITFTNTISYADRLLMKKHRRTDPGDLGTPRLEDDYPSPRSRYSPDDENRVSFTALYQASVANTCSDKSQASRPDSSLSIVELQDTPPRMRHLEHTDRYQVQEVGSFEAWQVQSYSTSPKSSRSATDSSRTPRSKSYSRRSGQAADRAVSETVVVDLYSDTPVLHTVPDSRGKSGRKQKVRCDSSVAHVEEASGLDRPKSRPVSRKSRQSVRPKSGRQSRANSRAYSRAGSTLGEGMLTKTPSLALHDIACRLRETDTHLFAPMLEDFFMVGVKPAPQERTLTPTADKAKKNVMKVSNRLYQMAPRSWRPDSSLGDVVPLDQVAVDDETTISYTYSAQAQGQPITTSYSSIAGEDNPSRSTTPIRSVSSPRRSQSRKASDQWSSRPAKSRSEKQAQSEFQSEGRSVSGIESSLETRSETRSESRSESRRGKKSVLSSRASSSTIQASGPTHHSQLEESISRPQSQLEESVSRPQSQLEESVSRPQSQLEESGRISQAVVMDGEDLTQYDDVNVTRYHDEDDEETLNQLEWELASESGRITADGQLSRLSMIERQSDSSGSRSSTPVIKLSMDKGFDINVKLRDEELCEEMDENANQMKDERDVQALH
ncbi:zinc finger B-box domain-containing protein 1-like isoform X1 [Haliotis rufescens]|uniref:zinc finger B-box domain-containing protein 1-like isoform X1 n=1 Tax=Haliotis rufescens TaxID=6454 RepID=UPI00201EF060|nr:zinc finger B-box domain-containing protein 1-like isoform X1 [Haliotis rufescens]